MEELEFFAGIDWGSETHQACIVDGDGTVLEERAFGHGGAGLAEMADWLLVTADAEAHAVGVAIEVPHGPVVETLMERGFAVHAINPKQLDRFRDRFSPAGAKDDRRDARVLADALRSDRHAFRRLDAAAIAHIEVVFSQLAVTAQQLARAYREIDRLTAALSPEDAPGTDAQRDVDILRSLPGVGRIVLATLLAEAHDALRRRDYQALRCLSGTAPVTRRSGKSVIVLRRLAAHNRLQNAVYHWAGVAVQRDPISKAKYTALRARGHSHARALRGVADRLLGVACAMLESQTVFATDHPRQRHAA